MTRWARVGSTQKHHKTPGDSTPWEELSKDAKKNSAPKDDKINRIQKGRIEKKKNKLKMGGPNKFTQSGFQITEMNDIEDLVKSDTGKLFKNTKLLNSDEMQDFQNVDQNPFAGLALIEDDQETDNSPKKVTKAKKEKSDTVCLPSIDGIANSNGKVLTKSQRKKARRKMRLEEKNVLNSQNPSGLDVAEDAKKNESHENNVTSPDKVLGKNKSLQKRKNRQEEIATENAVEYPLERKSMNMQVEVQTGNSENFDNKDPKRDGATEKTMTKNQWKKARRMRKLEQLKAMQPSQSQETSLETQTDEKSTASLDKDFLNKKQFLLEKLEKKKRKDGGIIRPSKVERKVFNIKRKLMDKGLSPNILGGVIQKERKREEEKFKKTFSTRPCFNCRQIGHLLSDCPLLSGDSQQVSGCFKCGSPDHMSYKCPKEVEGYPLAKCFVCKEQGHISKDCPKSEHGGIREKLEKKKRKDGGIIRPSKVERKIFNIKRKLMDKGLSPNIIAGVIQKERKHEEEKLKKTISTRPCFNCRQIGHRLSDCPLLSGDSQQGSGCFKCGSPDHMSYKCPKEVEGYPLAKCFVCKEQGHIRKDCPKSEHGGIRDEDIVLTVGENKC